MKLIATAIAAAALGGSIAVAQQSSPQPSPRPAQDAVPSAESAAAQMSGAADSEPPARGTVAAGEPSNTPAMPPAAGPEQGRRTVSIVPGADPGSILAVARARGNARLLADDQGDPLVEAIAGGRPYDITFYDCTGNADCQTIMLRAAFRASGQTADEMAEWNRAQRFGKAYLDAEGNPTVEMNVNLTGGVTTANLADSLDRWETVLSEFAGHVGY